eukprot:4516224-Pyramimonas_sp.AAC.1
MAACRCTLLHQQPMAVGALAPGKAGRACERSEAKAGERQRRSCQTGGLRGRRSLCDAQHSA